MSRQPESILIVGAQGSGKTTLADQLIQNSIRKTLIVDSDGLEKTWHKYQVLTKDQIFRFKSGRARIIFDEEDPQFFKILRHGFHNGVMVFDDAAFFLADRRAEHFRKMLMKNRQTNNDVIWICHGLSEIPPSFWTFFSVLILFKTTDSFERKKQSYPQAEAMAKRVEYVNKLAVKNPYEKKFFRLR